MPERMCSTCLTRPTGGPRACRQCRDLANGVDRECPWCGRTFRAKIQRGARGGPQVCCGKKCGGERANGKMHGPPRPPRKAERVRVERRCGWCDHVFLGPPNAMWCKQLHRHYGSGYVPLESPVTYGTCAQCDGPMCWRTGTERVTCSGRCRRRRERLREKAQKRNRNPGAYEAWKTSLKGGPVPEGQLRRIAERDGWICHLCGKSVPDRAWSAHLNDPVRDHLIPQAHGGSDDDSNLALAHNRCNMARGTKGIVQLRLAA